MAVAPPTLPDRLTLYRWAVQDPETQATVLRLMHERLNGLPGDPRDLTQRHSPTAFTLREDFAGTSAESVAWIALDPHAGKPDRPQRRAIAIDLDGPTLDWAAARASRLLGARANALTFLTADVTSIAPPTVPPADIIAGLNFSTLFLHERSTLDAYVRNACAGLAPGGILVVNLLGGPETVRPGVTTHHVTPTPRLRTEAAAPAFDYHWEVRAHDPATGRMDCRIHFTVRVAEPAGASPSRPGRTAAIRDAFTYDWRLWTPADVLAACRSAGFSSALVWRHTFDPALGADGLFLGPVQPESLDGLASWTAYIVAQR